MFGYNLTLNELLNGFHYYQTQDAKFINRTEVIFTGLKLHVQIVTRAHPTHFVLQIYCRLYCYCLTYDLN